MSNISFWLKKNSALIMFGGTFTLFFGYFGFNMYEQNRFQTPVVSQTINILSKNERIKQLLGFPLAYKTSSTRSMNQRSEQTYYSFTVAGPRGTTDVQVTSLKKPAKDIYQYSNQNQQLLSLKSNISQKQQQLFKIQQDLQQINSKLSKSKSFFKSSPDQITKEQLKNKEIQKNNYLLQIQGLKQSLEKKMVQRKRYKNEYYIPLDVDIYNQILSSVATGKNTDKVIPTDLTLCKISQLTVQLPNKSRISIISQGKNLVQGSKISFDLSNVANPSYQQFNKKLRMDMSELTKQQLQFYSKHKTDSMYKRYNMHRVLMGVLLGSCFLFGYKFMKGRKVISVDNSVLTQIMAVKFNKHPKIKQLSKGKKGKKINIDKIVTGGITKNNFDCSVGIQGVPLGKLQFGGTFKERTHEYQFNKFVFSYLQDNQIKKIDLLK